MSIPKDMAESIDRQCFNSFKDAYQRLRHAAASNDEAKAVEKQVEQTLRDHCPGSSILPPGYERTREQQFRLSKAQFVRLCRQVSTGSIATQQLTAK